MVLLRLISLIVLFASGSLLAQPNVNLEDIRVEYPEEDAIFLSKTEDVFIDIEKNELKITSSLHESMMFLSKNVSGLADQSIPFSGFRTVEDVDAKTWIKEKNKYISVPVNEIIESDRLSPGVFFDDQREMTFVFPAVKEGSISELNYIEKINEPRFLSSFYFSSYLPLRHFKYSINIPDNVKIDHQIFGGEPEIEFSMVEADEGRTIYTWEGRNDEEMEFENNGPSLSYYEPHLIIRIKEWTGKDGTVKILSDAKDLYSWYNSLVKDINKNPGKELEEITLSIISESQSDFEKVKSVFYWVQDNIKYIAFEDSLGGFIPRDASLVCQRKFGDCKDMSSILTEMLGYAGLNANLTWIGTRDIPYSYEEVPTPLVDNHMIASVEIDGERVFLDATGTYLKLGYPTAMIQGKQAMVGLDESNFELVRIPVMEPTKNVFDEKIELNWDGEILNGKANRIHTGYPKFRTIYRMEDIPDKRMAYHLKGLLEKGNNKFTLGDFEIRGREDRDAALEIEHEFQIADYARVIAGDLYINLNIDKVHQNNFVQPADRKIPIEREYKFVDRSEVVFEMPEGATIDYLPEDASFEHELFGFSVDYEVEGRKLIATRTFTSNYLILESEHFAVWDQMVKKLDETYQEVTVVKMP